MATREENIKKINEELEKVAGGSWFDFSIPKNQQNPQLNKS